jgi:hypothetical protein
MVFITNLEFFIFSFSDWIIINVKVYNMFQIVTLQLRKH